MSEHIWETFDGLFRTVHRQGQRVADLETRVAELERRLSERATLKEVAPLPSDASERNAIEEQTIEELERRAA